MQYVAEADVKERLRKTAKRRHTPSQQNVIFSRDQSNEWIRACAKHVKPKRVSAHLNKFLAFLSRGAGSCFRTPRNKTLQAKRTSPSSKRDVNHQELSVADAEREPRRTKKRRIDVARSKYGTEDAVKNSDNAYADKNGKTLKDCVGTMSRKNVGGGTVDGPQSKERDAIDDARDRSRK
jgi:hypothetical protein